MKVAVVGGGPSGLYFAMLAKRGDPRHQVTVYERNRPDDTFGFGVVFSEKTMNYLREQDRQTHAEILAAAYAWEPIEVRIHGQVVTCGGIGFWAISRQRLLDILQRGAAKEGVELRFETEVRSPAEVLADNDLVAAGDGVNSVFRGHWAEHFQPSFEVGRTMFAWYGAAVRFPSFTFLFEESQAGRFCAHIYPYEEGRSTFIVETDPESWRRAGLEESNRAAQAPGQSDLVGLEYFERLYAKHLDGHRLLANNSKWAPFRTLRNRSWHHRNLVLMGDAAHTAHFSVGSGTKMAMEDAIALAFSLLQNGPDLGATFAAYEAERRPRVEAIQRAAAPSLRWYEQFRHYWDFPAERFSFHFLTRGNLDYAQLKERDPAFVERVEQVVSPDLGALSSRVLSRSDLEGFVALWHPGRRGEGKELKSASALAYDRYSPVPQGLDRAEMPDLIRALVDRASGAAGRRVLLHLGRGGLFHSFLSPLANQRSDEFGGPLEERMRFPLEAVRAVRAATAGELWVAISATDWLPGRFSDDDAVVLARRLKEAAVDVVLVESGHVTPGAVPWYGRCFNAAFSDRVRNEVRIQTAVAGGILSAGDALNVLLAGRADLVVADAI
jgi:anthraniloyl-CoA monooxygenase